MKFLPNRIKICELCGEEIKYNIEYVATDVLQNDGTMFTKTKHLYCPGWITKTKSLTASLSSGGVWSGNFTYAQPPLSHPALTPAQIASIQSVRNNSSYFNKMTPMEHPNEFKYASISKLRETYKAIKTYLKEAWRREWPEKQRR